MRSQRDLAKVELDSSRQNLRQTEAQLKQAREKLAKTELRAPISGRVTAVTIKVGETAVPSVTSIAGSDLLVIADTSNLYAEVNVNETDVARVECRAGSAHRSGGISRRILDRHRRNGGRVAACRCTGQSKSYPVKIRLQPSADAAVPHRHELPCRDRHARHRRPSPVVAVPVQALQYEETHAAATRPHAPACSSMNDGKVSKREVETGIADDTYIEITKGVEAGAQIVIGPARELRFLRDGDRVKQMPDIACRRRVTAATVIELRASASATSWATRSIRRSTRIDLTIARNEFVALTGASGSGKSTMMNVARLPRYADQRPLHAR